MNTRQLIAAAAALTALFGAAVPAMAQEASSDSWMNVRSTLSRAEVQAQLQAARADGSMAVFKGSYLPSVVRSANRDAVRAETLRAIADGTVAALNEPAPAFATPSGSRAIQLAAR